MSEQSTSSHPAPHRNRVEFVTLLFGAVAAPLMWLGHLMLSYGVSSRICFPGDVAGANAPVDGLRTTLMVFDIGAIVVSLIGLAVSYRSWRTTRNEAHGTIKHAIEVGEGRTRFLAVWGMISSAMFLAAILFAVIASIAVPLCGK